jgi:hypothetical protein
MSNGHGVDVVRLKADIVGFSRRSRALKRVLRVRWERPMADEQRELAELRVRITRLCVLRAFLRGKVHICRPPRGATEWDGAAYHARVAERAAREYELPAESGACSSSTSA